MQQIPENPYLRYFGDLPGFQHKTPLTLTLFVEVRRRRRMGEQTFDQFHQALADRIPIQSDLASSRQSPVAVDHQTILV